MYVRESHASAGRAGIIAAGAVLGVAVPGGSQLGFASLVDLRSGRFLWFRALANSGFDLRRVEPPRPSNAPKTWPERRRGPQGFVQSLLKDFPL